MAADRPIAVSVVYSPVARKVQEVSVFLAPGSSVLQALQSSRVLEHFPELDRPGTTLGVWGRKVTLRQTLRQGDRVEIYRPLRVDPKVARRERFLEQGARGAGLFEKKKRASQREGD